MSERKFTMLVEGFIKRNVDYELLRSLDEDGTRRFIEKFTIELCKAYSPKRNYGISKDEVREVFIDILSYLDNPLYLDITRLYSYVNGIGSYRLVVASTKKQAVETAGLLGWESIGDTYGKKNSFQKVVKIYEVDDKTFVLTDKGEERPVNLFSGTINLFGNGGVVND